VKVTIQNWQEIGPIELWAPDDSRSSLKLVPYWQVSSLQSWVENGGEIPMRLKHQSPTKLPIRWQSHMR
jgi:hypothetical protein